MTPRGVYVAAITATVGNLLHGWDRGALAGALLYINPEFHLENNATLEGLVVAATLVGAIANTLLSGPLVEWLGRRQMLSVAAVLFCFSSLTMAFAPRVYILITARLLVGYATGLVSTISLVLVAELAPAEIRGELSTYPQLIKCTGMFLAYVLGFLVTLGSNPDWRLMMGILFVPSILYLLLCIFFVPESPRWLVSKGRMEEARQVLQYLRGQEDVHAELALLVEGLGVGVARLEEWILQPADGSEIGKYEKRAPDEIAVLGNTGGVAWKATPRTVNSSSHQLLTKYGTFGRSSTSFKDPMVMLAGSFQSSVTNGEGAKNAQATSFAQDKDNLVAERMDECVDTHFMSSVQKIERRNSVCDALMEIGGGWQLGWWHSPPDDGGGFEAGNLQRVYFFQEPLVSTQTSVPISLGGFAQEPGPADAAVLLAPSTQLSLQSCPEGGFGPKFTQPAVTRPVWKEFFSRGLRRALLVGVTLQVLQQLCGINAVLFFTPQILEQSGAQMLLASMGLKSESCSMLASGISSLLVLPCVILAMRLMDRSGRRQLLLRTVPVLALALLMVALANVFMAPGLVKAGVSFVGLTLFLCAFAMGFDPIPNVICAEIFPSRVRGLCIGICSASMWASNIIATYYFPLLVSITGLPGVFLIFFGTSIIAWIFIYVKVPETKGLPLEIIPELFSLSSDHPKNEVH